jgi:cytochrome c-type biogenesis protein CcmE
LKPRHKRLAIVVGALASLGIAAFFVLQALNSNIALFVTPSEVTEGKAPKDRAFRVGGMVKMGSIVREGTTARFVVTDTVKEIPVTYTGILPDLFKEGKGVVAEGRLAADGMFQATQVLAKHDENYMPPEAKHAVDQAQKTAKTLQQ